jgi:hypothetical protein
VWGLIKDTEAKFSDHMVQLHVDHDKWRAQLSDLRSLFQSAYGLIDVMKYHIRLS